MNVSSFKTKLSKVFKNKKKTFQVGAEAYIAANLLIHTRKEFSIHWIERLVHITTKSYVFMFFIARSQKKQ